MKAKHPTDPTGDILAQHSGTKNQFGQGGRRRRRDV